MGTLRRAACIAAALLFLAPRAVWAGLPAASGEQRAFLDVKINGKAQGSSLVVILEHDAYIRATDLKDSNVVVPSDAYRTVDGLRYVSLRGVDPNVTFAVDADALTLDVRFGSGSFGQTTLDAAASGSALPVSYTRSGYFNYAIAKGSQGGPTFAGEAVASIGHGVFDAYLQRTASGGLSLGQTSWTRDFIGTSERLVIGRSDIDVNDFAGTGSLVSMDGVTFRRDLRLNPGSVRNYNTGISGVASSASTVQVYVNGALVREEDISAGAFRITNVPLRDGANDTTVVIRDAFGHTQTISRPTFIGADMYRRGEREFAFGLGRLASTAFQKAHGGVGVARYGIGVSDAVTLGGRAEVSADVWSAGSWLATGTRLGQFNVLLSASGARPTASSSGTVFDAASGLALPVDAVVTPVLGAARVGGSAYGLSYNGSIRHIGIGASVVRESPFYATVGQSPLADRALLAERVYVSGSLPHSGTGISLSWTNALTRDTGRQSDRSVSLSQHVAPNVIASLSYGQHTLGTRTGGAFAVRVDAVLRRHAQIALSSSTEDGRTTRSIQVQHRPDGILGTAYSAEIGRSTSGSTASLDVVETRPFGAFELRHLSAGSVRETAFSFSGAVAVAGGGVFLTRPIQQSFVVVDTGGLGGLRTTVNNQNAGVTDRNGRALIADLFPYQRNDVAIDPNSLPDGALLDVAQQSVAPTYRGGAVLRFAVHRVRAFSGRLVFAGDAGTMPALGRLVLVRGATTADSDLGIDGTFYFDDLQPGDYAGRAEYKGGTCTLQLRVPASTGTVTDLGVVQCAKGPST